MQNETIDKLKEAGYITVTADSQGIADKVGIPEAFPYEFAMLPDFEDFSYTIKEGDVPDDTEVLKLQPVEIPFSNGCGLYYDPVYNLVYQVSTVRFPMNIASSLEQNQYGHYYLKVNEEGSCVISVPGPPPYTLPIGETLNFKGYKNYVVIKTLKI